MFPMLGEVPLRDNMELETAEIADNTPTSRDVCLRSFLPILGKKMSTSTNLLAIEAQLEPRRNLPRC